MANFHVLAGPDATPAHIPVRKISVADLKEALAKGVDDFMAMPTHLVFLGLIYPLFGLGLGALTFSSNALPLLFPLVSGFALIGPLSGRVQRVSHAAIVRVVPGTSARPRPLPAPFR
jgi:uncharacterized membrane protein